MQNVHSGHESKTIAAMRRFWTHGFEATSIDDLVTATGWNRAAIYSAFGGKKGLFLACIEAYRALVVTPAFTGVEAKDAGLAAIEAYFETLIAAAAVEGLPGPGCLIANLATEIAPHDEALLAVVEAHLRRLEAGFAGALTHEFGTPEARAREFGHFLAVSAQGLWSYSRSVATAEPLRAHARLLISLVKGALS